MRKFGLSFILWSWLSTTWAATAAQGLEALLRNLHTLQASFTQQITDRQGQVLQQSVGTMALERPGKFRWATTTPNQQLIIADGKTLWIDDQDLQQITHHPQQRAKNSPGLLLSESPEHLVQQFNIRREDRDQIVFQLTPRQPKQALFKSVDLIFNDAHVLTQMILVDNLNQQTQIDFTHVTLNAPLAPQLFIFQADLACNR